MRSGSISLLLLLLNLLCTVACGILDNTSVNQGKIGGTYIAVNNEYNNPTGKWFLDGGGNIGFGISTGEMAPKSEVHVSLLAHPINAVYLNRDVRFQLTKRDSDNRLIEIIEQETMYIETISTKKKYFTVHLLEDENVFYTLSVEILGEDERVEDTLISNIYVPTQILDAKLYTDKKKYRSDNTLNLTIENEGPTNLMLGYFYEIELYKNGEWKQVPIKTKFLAVGKILTPKQSFKQKISLEQLTGPGLYRILKEVDADGTDLSKILVVEFELVE